jgi:3',5'-cyclic-AMP phosphodiesterase
MKSDHAAVLQLPDLHLFAEPQGLFKNIRTRDSFSRVLSHVQQHYSNPDVIVITGDLAQDGKPETYQFIADALRVFSAPVYYVLGNHDQPDIVKPVYPLEPIRADRYCVPNHWQIILIDSNHRPMPDSYEGEVSEAELQRITELTRKHGEKWTLIAMHQNLPEHRDRGVAVEVRNHQKVMHHLEQSPNIKLVLSGHVHQEFVIVQNGICYFSTPATGYQSESKSGRVTGG